MRTRQRTWLRPRVCARVALALAVGAAGGSGGAAAQQVTAPQLPAQLTLATALGIARENSPGFLRLNNDVGLAQAARRTDRLWFLPEINTNINFSSSWDRRTVLRDGSPVDDPTTFRANSASEGLGIAIQVPNVLGTYFRLGSSRARVESAELTVAAQSAVFTLQITLLYYEALQRQSQITLEEQLLATEQDRLARTRELFKLAARKQVDVMGAEVQVASAELQVQQTRADAEKARLNLATALGVGNVTAFELVSDLPPIIDPGALDDAALIERALAANVGLSQQRASLQLNALTVRESQTSRLPSLGGQVYYNRNQDANRLNDALGLPRNSNWGFRVSVGLPLFTRFRITNQIRSAEATYDDARLTLRQEELGVERDVRNALVDLRNLYGAIGLNDRKAETARTRVELGQEQYRLGSIGFTELQQLVDQLAAAERAALLGRFSYARAMIQLEDRIGGPLQR